MLLKFRGLLPNLIHSVSIFRLRILTKCRWIKNLKLGNQIIKNASKNLRKSNLNELSNLESYQITKIIKPRHSS